MEAVEVKSVLHRVLISVIGIYDAPDFCFFLLLVQKQDDPCAVRR